MNPPRLYLMRHGHSQFQATYDVSGVAPGIEDARLTERGQAQVRAAAEVVGQLAPDLIVTSPFTRTIDTALGVAPPTTPVLVDAVVRERLNDASDVGSPASVLAAAYPMLEFAHLDEEWWAAGGVPDERGVPVETHAAVSLRAEAFLDWLRPREERSVLLVSHLGFIRLLSGIDAANCVRVRSGSRAGRALAVHALQRALRCALEARDGGAP